MFGRLYFVAFPTSCTLVSHRSGPFSPYSQFASPISSCLYSSMGRALFHSRMDRSSNRLSSPIRSVLHTPSASSSRQDIQAVVSSRDPDLGERRLHGGVSLSPSPSPSPSRHCVPWTRLHVQIHAAKVNVSVSARFVVTSCTDHVFNFQRHWTCARRPDLPSQPAHSNVPVALTCEIRHRPRLSDAVHKPHFTAGLLKTVKHLVLEV